MSDTAFSPRSLLDLIDKAEAPSILDTRTQAEFDAGHVPGAVNVPFASVLAGSDVPTEKTDTVVVYCGHGPRAWLAGQALRWRGYTRIVYLDGHMAAWRRAGLREEK